MEILLPLAVKSVAIAGATLLLLKAMQNRSAADRSWIAHLGLVALLLLPVGALTLPALEIAGPGFLASDPVAPAIVEPGPLLAQSPVPDAAVAAASTPAAAADALPVNWSLWAYLVPAGLLVLLTLVALARLGTLKARAQVLVDTHWLESLARAQRRMGFKNGTALLTSDDLRSPISWGLMRPVILLNSDAAKARGEAEAIIAHELAHIARLDWAKLMLARIATALFWFNPLVWLLAREAHQLREEAADDAVLGADIEDVDYANLLVGIARHESRGLLLGAHGVAPSRNSLARRVKRVLDAALERAPGGWRWSSAAAFFAAGMVVPVAALQFVAPAEAGSSADLAAAAIVQPVPQPVVSLPVAQPADEVREADPDIGAVAERPPVMSRVTEEEPPRPAARDANRPSGIWLDPNPSPGASIRFDSDIGAMRVEVDAARIALQAKARAERLEKDAVRRAIQLKALGAGRDYAAAIRRSAPQFRDLKDEDLAGFKAMGVSPEYIAAIRSVAPEYLAISAEDLMAFRAMGITPADVRRYRQAGRRVPSADQIVSMKAMGIQPEDIDDDGS